MRTPISPPPVTSSARDELPAYVSNGLVGIRVLDLPLLPGVVLVNGFAGLDPVVQVEAAAQAPYPIAGDLAVDGLWLRTSPQHAAFRDQRYDFATGELHTRFRYHAAEATANVDVLTFCSRTAPTVVLQEVSVEVDAVCELVLRAIVDVSEVLGRMARRDLVPPGEPEPRADGSLAWESVGALSRCGVAYVTELVGDADARRTVIDAGLETQLATEYVIRAVPGRTYRMRQLASLVPTRLHEDCDRMAVRLVTAAAAKGFDALRAENRVEWEELWKGRVLIDADDDRWQALADAAFFYLNASVHPSAPSSTSIFGLATWHDYHYYYGHVMWDIETFCVPPLVLVQPDAARSLLGYRSRSLAAARDNAKLHGRRGAQFPWESGPMTAQEAAPGAGKASWHEDHVSLDVAWAFGQYAHATGDRRFLADEMAPVVEGVADWVTSRVSRHPDDPRRFSFRATMGIAERSEAADDDAWTVALGQHLLREAIATAEALGRPVLPAWREVLDGLRVPRDAGGGTVISHVGWRPDEDKGSTPDPLATIFPLWHDYGPAVQRTTLERYLGLADGYIGSPMLSPFYGVWAAWSGDRDLARRLYERGYADMVAPRFLQTLEMLPSTAPDTPRAGPFFANLGGFLTGLLYGLPGIRVGRGEPAGWAVRPVVLPAGWRSIEVERAWVRMQPARIVARHGAERATIEVGGTADAPERPA